MPDAIFDQCRVIDAEKGLVEDLAPDGTPRRRVAIVGFAPSTRDQAPFGDPTWSIWMMNQLYRHVPRITRQFELHPHTGPRSYLADQAPGTDYLAWLRACPIPVYMQTRLDAISNSLTYPLDEMIRHFRLAEVRPDAAEKGYFHSSVDYMVALALAEGFEEIAIFGIDMSHDSEYSHQRPSGSFWIGLAHGLGVKLVIPPASALINNKGYRYAYDAEEDRTDVAQSELRQQALNTRMMQLQVEMHQLSGALTDNAHWLEYHKARSRGAILAASPPASTPPPGG